MNGFLKGCRSLIRWMAGLYALVLAVLMIFNVMDHYYVPVKYRFWIYIPVFLIITGLLFLLCRFARKRPESFRFFREHPWLTLCLCMLVTVIIQVFLVHYAWQEQGWDVAVVMGRLTGDIKEYARVWYMKNHPNNVFISGLLTWIIPKLQSLLPLETWHMASLLSVFAVDAAIVMGCVCARRFAGKSGMYLFLFLNLLLVAFQPGNMIPYTDTFGMLMVSMVILCLTGILTLRPLWSKAVLSVLLGLLLAIGYDIKPTIVIAGIAAVLAVILSLPKAGQKKILSCALSALLVIPGFFAAKPVQDWAERKVFDEVPTEEERDRYAYTMMHYFNMGLGENKESGFYGGFNAEDDQRISATEWKENKNSMSLEMAKERLGKLGFFGFLEHLWNKLVWISTDGNFYYKSLGRTLPEDGSAGTLETALLGWSSYTNPFYRTWTANYFEGVWIAVMAFMSMTLIRTGRKSRKNKEAGLKGVAETDHKKSSGFGRSVFWLTMRLSVLGILLFNMLFEARARYIYLYVPCFLMLAVFGLKKACSWLEQRKKAGSEVSEKTAAS